MVAVAGDWRWTDRGPVSRLRATLEARSLSEALSVFVAERLLQRGIENVTRYRYALTGSWDEPVLGRLDEPASAPPAPAPISDQ